MVQRLDIEFSAYYRIRSQGEMSRRDCSEDIPDIDSCRFRKSPRMGLRRISGANIQVGTPSCIIRSKTRRTLLFHVLPTHLAASISHVYGIDTGTQERYIRTRPIGAMWLSQP
jgi:hypothetical protein